MKKDRFLSIIQHFFSNTAKEITQEATFDIYNLLCIIKHIYEDKVTKAIQMDPEHSYWGESLAQQVILMKGEGMTWEQVGTELNISAKEAKNIYTAFEETLGTVCAVVLADKISGTQMNIFGEEDEDIYDALNQMDDRPKLVYKTTISAQKKSVLDTPLFGGWSEEKVIL